MLEHECSGLAVGVSDDFDVRGKECDYIEFAREFTGCPNPTPCFFQCCALTGVGVERVHHRTAYGFSRVGCGVGWITHLNLH